MKNYIANSTHARIDQKSELYTNKFSGTGSRQTRFNNALYWLGVCRRYGSKWARLAVIRECCISAGIWR